MTSAFLWGALAASTLLVGNIIAVRGLSKRNIVMNMVFGCGAMVSARITAPPALIFAGSPRTWPGAWRSATGTTPPS